MYVLVGLAEGGVDVVPSPNACAQVIVLPSGSLLPAEEKLTLSGAEPVFGVPLATAIGARFPPVPT